MLPYNKIIVMANHTPGLALYLILYNFLGYLNLAVVILRITYLGFQILGGFIRLWEGSSKYFLVNVRAGIFRAEMTSRQSATFLWWLKVDPKNVIVIVAKKRSKLTIVDFIIHWQLVG